MPVMEKYLTVEEVATELRVSTDSVLRWIKREELVAYKVGGVYRIHASDFKRFMDTRRTTKPEQER